MIKLGHGRSRSVRTVEELERGLLHDLESLTPEEREALDVIMAEMAADVPGPLSESLLGAMGAAEYVRQPVDMETFLKDKYYLGETCSTLYPMLMQDMIELFSGGYHEALLLGSLGWGKCVAGETEVFDMTAGCRRRADELGDFSVLSMGEDEVLVSRAARAFPSGHKECVRVTLVSGECVTLSTDHPIYTRRGWVPAGDLVSSDEVATPRAVYWNGRALAVDGDYVSAVACELARAVDWLRDRRVPAQFYGLSNEMVALFLAAFLSSVGQPVRWYGSSLRISLVSGGLVSDLRFLLLRLGVCSTTSVDLTRQHQLLVSGEHLARLWRWLLQVGCAGVKEMAPADVLPGLLWSTLRRVEVVGVLPVYDLSVEGTHSFVGNGVVLHNTFFATIGLCRILYDLSCMATPQRSFGLAAGTGLDLVGVSANEALAREVILDNVVAKVSASPYFCEHFKPKKLTEYVRFPNNIRMLAKATSDRSAIGLNMISAFMDETGFYWKGTKATGPSTTQDFAEHLYRMYRRRIDSRFKRHGRLPGVLFVVTSKTSTDDFASRRVREAVDDPTVFVRDYSLWDTRPEGTYSAKRFWVLVGNDTVASKILADGEEAAVRLRPPDNTVLVDVPEDFRDDFEADLEGSIRDLAGIATTSVHPYIQRREMIKAAVDVSRSHPFQVMSYDPSRQADFVWERLVHKVRERVDYGVEEMRYRPLVNPRHMRHVHIDASLRKDATGICMAHIAGSKTVVRRGPDGAQYKELAPVYYVDFLLQVVPPRGGEILLGELRSLVYSLTAHGYLIASVTQDSYQSADSLQQFRQQGYTAELLSVDVNADPYDNLKTALYEQRVCLYDYPVVIRELSDLQEVWAGKVRKIDHPKGKSKDVADALAGALFKLRERARRVPLEMSFGTAGDAVTWDSPLDQAVAAGVSAVPVSPVLPGVGGSDPRGPESAVPGGGGSGVSSARRLSPFFGGGLE